MKKLEEKKETSLKIYQILKDEEIDLADGIDILANILIALIGGVPLSKEIRKKMFDSVWLSMKEVFDASIEEEND